MHHIIPSSRSFFHQIVLHKNLLLCSKRQLILHFALRLASQLKGSSFAKRSCLCRFLKVFSQCFLTQCFQQDQLAQLDRGSPGSGSLVFLTSSPARIPSSHSRLIPGKGRFALTPCPPHPLCTPVFASKAMEVRNRARFLFVLMF